MTRDLTKYEGLVVMNAQAEITAAVCFLVHPDSITAGLRLNEELQKRREADCGRITGNRSGKIPLTVADLRYVTVALLRTLIETLESEV